MGSLVSPVVCNIYMEEFEKKALTTASLPPEWGFRYADDTHTKQKARHVEEFTHRLNSIDQDIQFTTEKEKNGSLAFLDTLTVKQQDGNAKVKVYRKPTHTDQHLNFESNQPLDHKLSVVRTLHHRADSVVSDPEDVRQEKKNINKALHACGYSTWAIHRALQPRRPKESCET